MNKCKSTNCPNQTNNVRFCDQCLDEWQDEYEATDRGQDEAAKHRRQDLIDRRDYK